MPNIKLVYFPMGGRAEPTRLAFHVGNVAFQDERISGEEVAKRKEAGEFPHGALPVLVVDGVTIPQSTAMLRYAGKLSGIYPKDELEALHQDWIVASVEEAISAMGPSFRAKEDSEKKALREQWVSEIAPKYLNAVEKAIQGDFVGKSLSIADLQIAPMVAWIQKGILDYVPKDLFEKSYPKMHKVMQSVMADSRIQAWYEAHK